MPSQSQESLKASGRVCAESSLRTPPANRFRCTNRQAAPYGAGRGWQHADGVGCMRLTRGPQSLPTRNMTNAKLLKETQLDLRPAETVRDAYERILQEATSNAQKGRWFEHLFMECARNLPEFDVDEIWTWRDWPEREELTGMDGRDLGIDLVARLNDGTLVAVQCKCYDQGHRVSADDIKTFLAFSDRDCFQLRWVVTTTEWNRNASSYIDGLSTRVQRINLLNFMDHRIRELARPAPRDPKPLQEGAIEGAYAGLITHGNDRGKLIMACGTGKTFVALRIAERVVPDNGRVLFAAPSISLVSQARKEWLSYTQRPMSSLVVCSDYTAGGKGQRHEAGPDDLVCPVASDELTIANHLRQPDKLKVIFCTYHSLTRVVEAQLLEGVPSFDLAIADEAHRTTGIDSKSLKGVNFQLFHDEHHLRSKKRIYMTATPRVYTESSKAALAKRGATVVDMGNQKTYGPELHRVSFKEAVANGELSDYRVIVLGVHESQLTPALRQAAVTPEAVKAKVDTSDAARLLGTALAMTGMVRGAQVEVPERLARTIAYASTINRSKWYKDLFNNPDFKTATTTRMRRAMADVERVSLDRKAVHMDASSSAVARSKELKQLNDVHRNNEVRMVSNVRIFGEGVDVPTLDAVSFLDPRNSQIDILQAVGRVMRRAEGKRFGYIIVPISIPEGVEDVAEELANRGDGYSAIGKVLRALQSHDERLAEDVANFLVVAETPPGPPKPPVPVDPRPEDTPTQLLLQEVDSAEIYTHVASASGLGKPGQMTAITIEGAVKRAAAYLQQDADAIAQLRPTLDLDPATKPDEVATVAALLLCNALLMHKRLKNHAAGMAMLVGLDAVARAKDPVESLIGPWETILERDFEPIFRPALAVLQSVPRSEPVKFALVTIVECANQLADEVGELGYDHAGPLYHRILGSAVSDGAFYTKHISALMLAGLTLSPDMIDWSDADAIKQLRVLDPACGTGTLLMAALKVIKDRALESGAFTEEEMPELHRHLVQHAISGLDINYQATQLAASNLTLGAPSVDYESMQIHTMKHGPQPDGSVKLGSLELLLDAVRGEQPDLLTHARHAPLTHEVSTRSGKVPEIRDVDVVIMNPPFTNNKKRSKRYGQSTASRMKRREEGIKEQISVHDEQTASAIDPNSAESFFAPLAESLVDDMHGTLGQVMPTTACTGEAASKKRKMLADRFHIETVVTTHDPKSINFSENTGIHESLMVCRRRTSKNHDLPTRFVSLRKMPFDADEVADWLADLEAHEDSKWHRSYEWPRDRVAAGDWTPAQYYDGELAAIALGLSQHRMLAPLNDLARIGSRGAESAFDVTNIVTNGGGGETYFVMWTHKTGARTQMLATPELCLSPKPNKRSYVAESLSPRSSNLLVGQRIDTTNVRTPAIFANDPCLGSAWAPITPFVSANSPNDIQQAWCAYFNSTCGALSLLNIRARKLTYPAYKLAPLRSLPLPDPSRCDITPLVRVFDEVCEQELQPWAQMDSDPVRHRIDHAVAEVLSLDEAELADWRRRIVNEPTVSNRPAE